MSTVEERVLLAHGLWRAERQLLPAYERLHELAKDTDCLEEAGQLLELQKDEIEEIKALIAALHLDASSVFEALTFPATFDALLEFLRARETEILEDYYLKLDSHIVDALARQIMNRLTAKQVRQLRLIRRCLERRERRPGPPPERPAPPEGRIEYVVQPGDTLFLIAARYGVTLDALIRANPQIADPNLIRPGEVIFIPVAEAPPPGRFRKYVVQPGDTMFIIARRFGVTLDQLIAANPGIDPERIVPGQVINVPVAGAGGAVG